MDIPNEESRGLLALLIGAVRILRPPRMLENGHRDNVEKVQLYEARLRRWRNVVWLALLTLFTGVTGEILLAWGVTPAFSGFEHRSEAAGSRDLLATRLQAVERHLLESSLLAAKQGQCTSDAKQYFTQRLQDLREEYKRLAGSEWTEPTCDEVKQ